MKRSFFLSFAPALVLALSASAQPALEIFATGGIQAQGLSLAPSGQHIIVVNTNGIVLSVPVTGGVATPLTNIPIPPSTTCTPGSTTPCVSLRDGAFLPDSFGAQAGKFLVVGGRATTNTPAYASTVEENGGAYTVAPYATQASSLWSASVVATGFGRWRGGVLVVNQGSGQGLQNGGVDYFAPDGSVSLFAALPEARVPYGAAFAPESFGDIGGNLVVSDAQSGRIYNLNPQQKVRLFATVPSVAGLRQVAFAPATGWGAYSGHMFVSVVSGEVVVLNGEGRVVGRIGGLLSPRSLLFTNVNGAPSLLIGETSATRQLLYRAGPEDIIPAP